MKIDDFDMMDDTGRLKIPLREWTDELQFLDPDLRAAFEGKQYMRGVPTMVQHTRTMQRLIESQTQTMRSFVWYINNRDRDNWEKDNDARLMEGVRAYQDRFGFRPTTVRMNPEDVPTYIIGDLQLWTDPKIGQGFYYFGLAGLDPVL